MQIFHAVASTTTGQVLPSAPVTVYLSDGVTLAPAIYAKDGVTHLDNPFAADPHGVAEFAAPDGKYVVSASTPTGPLTIACELIEFDNIVRVANGAVVSSGGSTVATRLYLQSTLSAAPSISSIPSTAAIGATITITGSGFTGATGVQFGEGIRFNPPLAASFQVVNDTTIHATVPAVCENGYVYVLHPVGNAKSPSTLTISAAPTADRVSPTLAGVGQKLSVFGLRFTGLTSILIGTAAASQWTVINDRTLEIVVPAGATTGLLTLANVYGSVNVGTVTIGNAPSITSFTPTTANIGDTVVVTGNFTVPPTMVTAGGIPAHWWLSDSTHLNFTTPNVQGGSGTIKITNFCGVTASATPLSINGTGPEPYDFYIGDVHQNADTSYTSDVNASVPAFPTAVYWNGTALTRTDGLNPDALPVRYDLYGQSSAPIHNFRVVLPVGADGETLTGAVTAVCPTGNGTVSYLKAPNTTPIVTGFSPSSGPKGTRVTLTGSGFLAVGYVRCGGIDCSHQIVNDTTIICEIHQNCSSAPFTVYDLNFQGNGSADTFEVTPTSFTISALSHTSGPPGTEVQLTADDFRGITDTMSFVDAQGNNIDLQLEYCLRSQTALNVMVPMTAAQGAGHFLINGITSPSFTVTAAQAPTITAPTGTQKTGDVIPLKGQHFNGVTDVQINGTSLTAHKYWCRIDSRTIAIVLPAGTTSNCSFTVVAVGGTTTVTSTLTISGAQPAPSFTRSGNAFHDANGSVFQVRGAVASAFEDYSAQGFDPWLTSDAPPYGYEPNWAQLRFWGINTIRLPLNEASWLGYWCKTLDGTVVNPDPTSTYRQVVTKAVQDATDAGLCVLLDLHWTAPGNQLPYAQIAMMDQDNSLRFWYDVANTFKSNPGVFFEVYNEPFVDTGAFPYTVDWWTGWKRGGLSVARFSAVVNRDTGQFQDYWVSWTTAGLQQGIDAIRGTGATNVCIVGGYSYSGDATGMLHNMPVDQINQIAVNGHWYSPLGGSGLYSEPSSYPVIDALYSAGYPVITSETGDVCAPGMIGSPFYERWYTDWDTKGYSYIAWTWNPWGQWNNCLIRTFSGRPTPGWGFYYLNKLQTMAGITYTGNN